MNYDNILKCFPINISTILRQAIEKSPNKLEEIRVRLNLPIILKLGKSEEIIKYYISIEEINYILQRICENSLYSYQEQIINGYITINGGHRIGLVGEAVVRDNKIININYISGLNFRISKQVLDCSESIIKHIIDMQHNNILNTLIISPPGLGKTTLLRDIVRKISNGFQVYQNVKFNGINVSVIDERGEIGACYKGVAQNDLGIRTDVFSDIPKAIGMGLAIRSMAPKVIVADELGSIRDAEAIKYATSCGIKGVFTTHGKDINDLIINPAINDLLKNKVFDVIIFIKDRDNEKYITDIYRLNFKKEKYEII